MTEREFAIRVVQKLQRAGFQALWAGGCVRDELLGLTPKDYDVATDARPEQVRGLFKRTIAVGMSFGVVEVIGPRLGGKTITVQVATFRSDLGYSDGRRPDRVIFSSPEEDAARRDFTVNGMFCDPIKGELLDFVGGQQDLRDRILRAIGDPFRRFDEDKLRLLRAVRMATRFDLEMEPQTAEAIRQMAAQIIVVSAERIAEELRQILVHPRRVRGMELMLSLGLVKPILPELLLLVDIPCQDAHAGNLWEHTLRVLNRLGPKPGFPLAFAALLHEIGQPEAAKTDRSPEEIGAKMVEGIADKLRLSNAEKDLSVWLVKNQRALCKAQEMRLSTLKRILVQEHIRKLLKLHRADALARGESDDHVRFCEEKLATWTQDDLDPPPIFSGDDLKRMGLKPGPMYKEILEAVRDAQLEGAVKTEEEALRFVEEFLKQNQEPE